MNSERWKRSSTLPAGRTGSTGSEQGDFHMAVSSADQADSKRPRGFSKALRTLSSSSLDSLGAHSTRSSGSQRRLHKSSSNSSSSMIERLHRRVSKDSNVSLSSPECPDSPLDQPYAAMTVVQSGPLKLDVSLLKARSEYLVLADQCLVKVGSAEAAKSVFPQLNQSDQQPGQNPPSPVLTHRPSPADIRLEIPLRSVVAVFNEEGSSPRFGIEVWWLSPWPRLSYCRTNFFFSLPKERDDWLAAIQKTCRARLRKAPTASVIPETLKSRINHVVSSTEMSTSRGAEAQNLIFPVAKRGYLANHKTNSADDGHHTTELSSYYLVIGPCMCYFVEVLKAEHTTPPGELRIKVASFGTVTLTRFRASVASYEQRFVMCFRSPFGREMRLDLASSYYRRVIETLTKVDRILKPMWPQHFQQSIFEIRGLPPPLQLTSGNDLGGLERSLHAYCTAFHVHVPDWTIEWPAHSSPAFRLLPMDGVEYTPLQLLAVFRALRYNSFFKAISLRDVDLSSLIGKKDYTQYGDSVMSVSLTGRRISEDHHEMLAESPILAQEIHALMFGSESIKSVDLTNIWGIHNSAQTRPRASTDYSAARKMTSVVLRPILTLMGQQLCMCRSITLAGNPMAISDIEELANLLGIESNQVRELDLSNCYLGDAGLSQIWAGLAGQGASLESLDTSKNQGIISADTICETLSSFRAIRHLNIAGNTRLDPDAVLLDETALHSWFLEELDLSNIALNDVTIDTLASYLQSERSESLHALRLNKCGVTGRQVARLFRGMGQARRMTVHINGSRLDEGVDDLCSAIACGYGPWSLFVEMIDFSYEESYVKLLRALALNKTIECLCLAGTSTPDAVSDTACKAIATFLADNNTVRFLDLSGFDSKLDEGRLGRGFSKALSGIRNNTRIEHLRVRSQMLNFNIGDLAEAISGNQTLHTLDCEGNDFNLSNFRHLVKHLEENMTICQFSALSEAEFAQSLRKAVDSAGVLAPPPARRQSVMSRFRHERPSALITPEKSLEQQLRDEWVSATADLDRILSRNRKIHEQATLSEDELVSSSHAEDSKMGAFTAAFGGLALKQLDDQQSRAHDGTESPPLGTISEKPGGSLASANESQDGVQRSSSNASSEESASPTTRSVSTESGIPTPPEFESPTERNLGLESLQSPDTPFDDLSDYTFISPDGLDGDVGLSMKPYKRGPIDAADRIDEEDDNYA